MNKSLSVKLLLMAVTAFSAASCQWRELDYDFIDTAGITVVYHWGESGLRTRSQYAPVNPGDVINGRTAAFYPSDGRAPVIRMSHSDTVSVNLPVGQYEAVFFNETFDDFDNIRFSGTDCFETLEALAKEDVTASTRAGSTIARQPDILAVETMAPLEVTDDVVRHMRIIGTTPRSVVYKVILEVKVQGLDDIVSAGGYVSGFAGGYDFSEGCPTSVPVSHKVTFTDKSFTRGSEKDGTLTTEFQCFGYRGGASLDLSGYTFDFRAVLVNGETCQEKRAIDNLIAGTVEDGSLILHITIGSGLGGSDTDGPIVIPDVEPVAGEGMWHVLVGDWDEVVIPIGL